MEGGPGPEGQWVGGTDVLAFPLYRAQAGHQRRAVLGEAQQVELQRVRAVHHLDSTPVLVISFAGSKDNVAIWLYPKVIFIFCQ